MAKKFWLKRVPAFLTRVLWQGFISITSVGARGLRGMQGEDDESRAFFAEHPLKNALAHDDQDWGLKQGRTRMTAEMLEEAVPNNLNSRLAKGDNICDD
jgi:hypothetical protein